MASCDFAKSNVGTCIIMPTVLLIYAKIIRPNSQAFTKKIHTFEDLHNIIYRIVGVRGVSVSVHRNWRLEIDLGHRR